MITSTNERQTPITQEALEATSGWEKWIVRDAGQSFVSYVYELSQESILRSLRVLFLPDGLSVSLTYGVYPLPRIKTMEQLNTLVELLGVDDVA